jgi:5-formyltetrahydrofolate cyclo-ligase
MEMKFYLLDETTEFEISKYGIREPKPESTVLFEPMQNDVIFVVMPGAVFDRNGNRIGYGGGFYDKFLSAEPDHPTVALCYDFQVISKLETEEFDIPVDLVLY